jgi:predicted phage tail component-like protein
VSGMTYRGIRKDYITVLRDRKRPPWAPIQRNILTIPGMAGGYLSNTETGPRPLEVPVLIQADSFSDLQKLKEDLAAWLITDTPQELVFDDEPDRTYYAVVDGSLDLDELVRWGQGVIKFICPDPFKYGPVNPPIPIPVTADGQKTIVQNNGSAETYPTFTITVNQPITFLDIITPDNYMRIGQPYTADQTPKQKYELMLNDEATTISGWVTANEVDGGVVSGVMISDGERFVAENYGTGNDWHGPAIKKSVPELLTDFRVEMVVSITSKGDSSQNGRVECYLLGQNNNVIGKMAIKDVFQGVEENHVEFRVGNSVNNTFIFNNRYPKKKNGWNNFYGLLRFERIKGVWYCYVAKIDTKGYHYYDFSDHFTDRNNLYSEKLSQIQLHIGQKGTNKQCTMAIYKVKVYKVNDTNIHTEVPFIADVGDLIEINHQTNKILKNGEDFNYVKDFGANFFPIGKGQTEIMVNPPGVATVEMTFRERWK